MQKNAKIGVAILIIALIGTGAGIGVYFTVFQQTPEEEADILSVTDDLLSMGFSLSELKSDKYQQIENQQYFFKSKFGDWSNATYSGVSLRSILEVEKLLYTDAFNFSFVGGDGFNPAIMGPKTGWLNISWIMEAPYELCILAYGGEDFVSSGEEPDGPVMPVINQSIVPDDVPTKGYRVTGCAKILFFGTASDNYEPLLKTDVAMTIHSLILQFQLTMTELQSSKYEQITNQLLFFQGFSELQNATYSGASLKSILEVENLLGQNALNYSFVGGDGFNPAIMGPSFGWLNISEVMSADYGLCLITYGGIDFEPGDGPLMSAINQSLVPEGVRSTAFRVTNTTEVLFV
ncbi:MAG: hypothetical protein ACQERB_15235 [Promethearchaeati archaeon]